MPPFAYDEIAYPGQVFAQTHPDRLATLGRLFGLTSADPEQCSFLEVGCGDGENLIGAAYACPASRFVGFDLSSAAIARGQEAVRELVLTNIELNQADLMHYRPGEKFDFIVAHGFMSWVPPAVQDRLLAFCREFLAPRGIAFISYNTYPGFHVRRMLRDMMRYHVEGFPTARQKIDQARGLIQFLIAAQTKDDEFAALLNKEAEWILNRDLEGVLYHDDLAEVNHPFYFHEFMAQASIHGLQYLAEADFREMQDRIYPEPVVNALTQLGSDVLRKEQYLDFLKCRRFRQTLLVHREQAIQRDIDPLVLVDLLIASPVKPESPTPNLAPSVAEKFIGPRGGAIQIDHDLTKAALLDLREAYPLPIGFRELLSRARTRLRQPGADSVDDAAKLLAEALMGIYSAGMIEVRISCPAWATQVSEKPKLSPLARRRLQQGRITVPSLRGTEIPVDPGFHQALLLSLDGTRDRSALMAEVGRLIDERHVELPPGLDRTRLPGIIDASLARAARTALLIA